MTPLPPPHIASVYTLYLFTQGRGKESQPERMLEGQQFTKLCRNTNMTVYPVYKLW